MNMKTHWIIRIYGILWLAVGVSLLRLGHHYLEMASNLSSTSTPDSFFKFLLDSTGSSALAMVVMVTLSLIIGGGKGLFVLWKAASKSIGRIRDLQRPISLKVFFRSRVFIQFLIVCAVMMTLGKLLGLFQVPAGPRGIVDLAIGVALCIGSTRFFIERVEVATDSE